MVEPERQRVVRLPLERRVELVASRERMAEAQHSIDVLKKVGLDVTPLQEKLDWAVNMADTILEEF